MQNMTHKERTCIIKYDVTEAKTQTKEMAKLCNRNIFLI